MLRIENLEVMNFKGALRGMRNPLASWDKADSNFGSNGELTFIGASDKALALKLTSAGSDHAKFLRQILVCMDITAPDYWWKEMDTYKVSTVANSTSTMHKLVARTLTVEDFSWDTLTNHQANWLQHLNDLIAEYKRLHVAKELGKAKKVWRELIQNLPMSFNYTRTWSGNYENLRNIYHSRRNHKLEEWQIFCRCLEEMPFSDLIMLKRKSP